MVIFEDVLRKKPLFNTHAGKCDFEGSVTNDEVTNKRERSAVAQWIECQTANQAAQGSNSGQHQWIFSKYFSGSWWFGTHLKL